MTIEFNPAEPTFQWAIVRGDGAIICACASEDAAARAMEAVEQGPQAEILNASPENWRR